MHPRIPLKKLSCLSLLLTKAAIAGQAMAHESTLLELKAELAALTKKVAKLERLESLHRQSSVQTSSAIGLRSSIDGSDLLVNLPSMNEDVRLLEQRRVQSQKDQGAFRPSLRLSGGVAGQAYWQKVGTSGETDIDLSSFTLTMLSVVNPWVQVVGTINYDNNPFNDDSGLRISNSRLYLKRAFTTFGNLEKTGLYASIGQMYAPFGRYASGAISSPMTAKLGRVSSRNLVMGYVDHSDHGRALLTMFMGSSDASTAKEEKRINQGGLNGLFSWQDDTNGFELGAGWLYNLGGAGGVIHALGADNHAQGNNVHALDAHTSFRHKRLSAHVEYLGALSSFKEGDTGGEVTIVGQRPHVLHTELGYATSHEKPLSIALDYGTSWDAKHLLPQHSFGLTLSKVLLRDTIASFEYRHNDLYLGETSHAENRVVGKINVYF